MKVQGPGFRASGFRVQDLGFTVEGLGFRGLFEDCRLVSLCIGFYGQCVFTTEPHNGFPSDVAGRRWSRPSSSSMLMYVGVAETTTTIYRPLGRVRNTK